MAQIVLGPLASAIAGSIAGTTFQRSPSGTIVRKKPLPTVRKTPAAITTRSMTEYATAKWRTLTPTQRKDWKSFADSLAWTNRFGDAIQVSGYVCFLAFNSGTWSQPNETYTLPFFTDPPSPGTTVNPSSLSAVYDSGTGKYLLLSSDATTDSNTRFGLFISPRLSYGRTTYHGRYIFSGTIEPSTSFPVTLDSYFAKVYGSLPSPSVPWSWSLQLVPQADDSGDRHRLSIRVQGVCP